MNPLLEKHVVRHYVVAADGDDEKLIETKEHWEFNKMGKAWLKRVESAHDEAQRKWDITQGWITFVHFVVGLVMIPAPIVFVVYVIMSSTVEEPKPLMIEAAAAFAWIFIGFATMFLLMFLVNPFEKRKQQSMRNSSDNPLALLLKENQDILPAMEEIKSLYQWEILHLLPCELTEGSTS